MADSCRPVVLVAHLSGAAGRQKVEYLERVDVALRKSGYRLILIDQAGARLETRCDSRTLLGESARLGAEFVNFTREVENVPAVKDAVSVDAGHRRLALNEVSRELLCAAYQIRNCMRGEGIVLAILWHQFNGMSMLLRHLCERDRLPLLYAHLGALPETICFEQGGQMAESWVCTHSERFTALPVEPPDLERATRYLALARDKRLDRKPQPEATPTREVLHGLRGNASGLVFYAGQNDYRTGMLPRSLPKACLHSTFFQDTLDGLRALADAAAIHNWKVVFKPHPNVRYVATSVELPEGVVSLPEGNVFECILGTDVTATIVSSTAYLALLHGRPVVLMGRMPLSGKGCTYELEHREGLQEVVSRAFESGLTARQSENFKRHVAQLMRFSLFAYRGSVEDVFGRGAAIAAAYIIAAAERRVGFLAGPDATAGAETSVPT